MPGPADHDAYIAALPGDRAAILSDLRRRIGARLPGATEVISYAMPGFRLPSGKVALGYAGWKGHYAIYPHSGTALAGLGDLPEGITATTGTLKVPWSQEVPDALLDRVVAARLAELG
ncbi:MAG: iron chaperone [Pseudooceanicola sp.]